MDDVMEPDDGMVELEPEVAGALRAVPPVESSVRSAAIAAALNSVDADVVPIAAARSRRLRVMSSMTAAAATVALVVAGITVTNSGGDDSADFSAAEEAAEEPIALEPSTEMVAEEPTAAMYESAAADEPVEEPAAEEYALEESAVAGEASTAERALPVIENESELIDQIDFLASQVSEGRVDPPTTECVMIGGGPVGRALFEGLEVVLFRDLASGTYTALSADDCSPVAQISIEP